MANPEFKPGKNKKAGIFEAYMKTNELSYFKRRDVHDGMDTVAFITALPAGDNHRLVAAVWALPRQGRKEKNSSNLSAG